MKLVDAETLLRVLKLDGPIREPWSVETDEGITLTALPAGVAFGAYLRRDMCTVVPKTVFSRAWFMPSGVRGGHVSISAKLGCHCLFAQEEWVYRIEMREAMRKAVTEAATEGKVFPRHPLHKEHDINPYPEDFKMTLFWPAVIWQYEGEMDVAMREVRLIKKEFCELLERFAEGKDT